ncbi:MAG TPA: hypothetical protein VLM11_10215 [Streptosporangiaceae bacterium]|nr:hypothetical protein [Streptosporangiaceae bacterium]
MSSSFLYLAIVAVWAFVLVPRWLRRQHAQLRSRFDVDVEVDVEYAAEYDAETQCDYSDVQYPSDVHCHSDVQYPSDVQHGGYPVDVLQANRAVDGGVDRNAPVPFSGSFRGRPTRSRVLKARRRLLAMLLLLTAVAGACTALKVTSWWAVLPPAGLLVIYLLLLREAALADAEQARRLAAIEARARPTRQRAHAAAVASDAELSAQIIDISARVADQLYDQYADAAVRAVGD